MPGDLTTEALTSQILDVIAKEGKVPRAAVTLDATMESLGFASVDIMLMLNGIEEEFDVDIPIDGPLADCRDMRNFVGEVAGIILQQKSGQETFRD